jgi:hypothetical protein
MANKHLVPEEGEQIILNMNHPVVFICCDCGLAHKHEYILPPKKGFMRIKMWRDNRTTAQMRRYRKHDFVPATETEKDKKP